jgi:hypothetical protein
MNSIHKKKREKNKLHAAVKMKKTMEERNRVEIVQGYLFIVIWIYLQAQLEKRLLIENFPSFKKKKKSNEKIHSTVELKRKKKWRNYINIFIFIYLWAGLARSYTLCFFSWHLAVFLSRRENVDFFLNSLKKKKKEKNC